MRDRTRKIDEIVAIGRRIVFCYLFIEEIIGFGCWGSSSGLASLLCEGYIDDWTLCGLQGKWRGNYLSKLHQMQFHVFMYTCVQCKNVNVYNWERSVIYLYICYCGTTDFRIFHNCNIIVEFVCLDINCPIMFECAKICEY